MPLPDVVIAGAGLIGLACALECHRRGLRVTVLERGRAMRQASWAAAGMLAAHDPSNPVELQPLSRLSICLYPAFLKHLREWSGMDVPIETEWVLEPSGEQNRQMRGNLPDDFRGEGFRYAREQSLDPRKLASAVLKAVRAMPITLEEETPVNAAVGSQHGVAVDAGAFKFTCGTFVDCTGAWSADFTRPAKGQMVRVRAPGSLAVERMGNVVLRADDVYLVPRLDGTVVIGATLEDAGFDTAVHDADLSDLRRRAAALLPAIKSAPMVEAWAGLRPDTPDHLPFLGATGERTFVAAGHFRNGVLLAPATAHVVAQLLLNEQPTADLQAFSPQRFALVAGASRISPDGIRACSDDNRTTLPL